MDQDELVCGTEIETRLVWFFQYKLTGPGSRAKFTSLPSFYYTFYMGDIVRKVHDNSNYSSLTHIICIPPLPFQNFWRLRLVSISGYIINEYIRNRNIFSWRVINILKWVFILLKHKVLKYKEICLLYLYYFCF